MTTGNTYDLHGIQLGSGFLSQLNDATPAYNMDDLVEFAAGQTAPQFAGSNISNPDLPFTTKQLKTLLDEFDVEDVIKDLSGGNVDVYFKQRAPNALRTPDASLAHIRGRLTSNAMLYLQSIRAQQSQDAEASARLLPSWDGSNNPLIMTGSVALSGTSTADHTYTLGRIDLNGTNLAGVQEMTLDLGMEEEAVADSGEPFPSFVGINRYAPTVVLQTRDTTLMATYGGTGTVLASMEVYLRKKSSADINVADGTAEHIKITASDGLIRARQIAGLDGMCEVHVQILKPNATTAPLTINTASAIT